MDVSGVVTGSGLASKITHHRGRTVIAYAVDQDTRLVSILGVLYGGQDFERALAGGGDA